MPIPMHELERETAEFLPDREVMSASCQQHSCCGGDSYFSFVGDDSNTQVQNGLINVGLQDVNILAFD
jgi:hypothetical protein